MGYQYFRWVTSIFLAMALRARAPKAQVARDARVEAHTQFNNSATNCKPNLIANLKYSSSLRNNIKC